MAALGRGATEENVRFVLSLAFAALTLPAFAGEPYTPIKLKPAEIVTPSEDLIAAARAFLAAIENGDGDAIKAGMAAKVTGIDGALDLHIKRRQETFGPYDTVEQMLVPLASYIGGIYEMPADGGDATPFAIKAERQYIFAALTDPGAWGTDPMVKGGVCTYAYRSFDQKAVKALADKLEIQSSGFFYVDQPTPLLAAADSKAATLMTLEPDLLYALDYNTDAPSRWIAVHMPEGGSGFLDFRRIELSKPYAAGICFTKSKDGKWLMSAQVSTSL
jgi:hypothetical protein